MNIDMTHLLIVVVCLVVGGVLGMLGTCLFVLRGLEPPKAPKKPAILPRHE